MNAKVSRKIALSCLDFLSSLLDDEALLVALDPQKNLFIIDAIRASLDLLADMASLLSVKQPDEARRDFGPEPLTTDSVPDLLRQCKEFLASVREAVGVSAHPIDWASIGVRAQTFSVTLCGRE